MTKVIQGVNDLYSQRPDLMTEWDWDKNNEIGMNPTLLTINSNKRAYWVCNTCKHEWDTILHKRARLNQGCPVCTGKKVKVGYNDLYSTRSDLMDEWDWDRNNEIELYPTEVTVGCNKYAYWKCESGHEWKAVIATRCGTANGSRKGRGCPMCDKSQTSYPEQFIYESFNQFFNATVNKYKTQNNIEYDIVVPELRLAIEYNGSYYHQDNDKERGIRKRKEEMCAINNISYIEIIDMKQYSELPILNEEGKIFFKHVERIEDKQLEQIVGIILQLFGMSVENISFEDVRLNALVAARAGVNIENSLASKFPLVAKEFNVDKNGINTSKICTGSTKHMWWKCNTCGHEWMAMVVSRTHKGSGCPACSGRVAIEGKNDFLTLHPKLALDWSNKNKLPPRAYTKCSGQKVYWRCQKCGYEWYGTISNRVSRNSKCPDCKFKPE